MMGDELELMRPSGVPAMDSAIDRLYGQMIEAADAGDVTALGRGIGSIDLLIDRLDFVRREAGRRTYDLLPDERYRYRKEERTRKAMYLDGRLAIEPYLSGGGWRGFDFKAVLKRVADKVFGLRSRIISPEGEVVGDVEAIVDLICEVVSFSNVKSNEEKKTGLAAFGFGREDFGEYAQPRKDVRVQHSPEEQK